MMPVLQDLTPGSQNNYLFVQTSQLGFDYDLKLSDWNNQLTGERVYFCGRTEPLEGGTGLSIALMVQGEEGKVWESTIPYELIELSKPFAEYQYQMLYLANHSSAARQLLELRPILLALICEAHSFDSHRALRVCELGQREILQTLGLSSTKAALKFIDKIRVDFSKGTELILIRQKLDPASKRYLCFSHLNTVSYLNLIVDQTHPFVSGTRFGEAISQVHQQRFHTMCGVLEDTVDLGRRLNKGDVLKSVGSLSSLDALRDLHDNWATEFRRNRALRLQPNELLCPDEPYTKVLCDTDNIKQIMNLAELREEGDVQKHCVEIYHNRIARGEYAVFKILHPERLTVGISKQKSGTFPFKVEQISGFRNAKPSNEARALVYSWFCECKESR